MIDIDKINFSKLEGLVPAIIIDYSNDQVLMLGFMNEESLQKTLTTGLITFYSRTKKRLWTKGETSGNNLKLKKITTDCDNDTLLIYAEPLGATCHTGAYSCFGIEKNGDYSFLSKLFSLIKERQLKLPEDSYTSRLFREGPDRIIQKVGEESFETVIAAKNRNREEIINETSDLIYHLFVMLAEQNIDFEDVVKNLAKRHK